jgi:hypothetical protein
MYLVAFYRLGEEGLEPPTPRFVAACSNPLSYTPKNIDIFLSFIYKSGVNNMDNTILFRKKHHTYNRIIQSIIEHHTIYYIE